MSFQFVHIVKSAQFQYVVPGVDESMLFCLLFFGCFALLVGGGVVVIDSAFENSLISVKR